MGAHWELTLPLRTQHTKTCFLHQTQDQLGLDQNFPFRRLRNGTLASSNKLSWNKEGKNGNKTGKHNVRFSHFYFHFDKCDLLEAK